MKPEEVIRRTRSLLEQEKKASQPEPGQPAEKIHTVDDKTLFASWPECEEGEFLIPIDLEDERIIFCVRELTWREALDIDALSFRTNDYDTAYFAEEHERRETLKRAIVWVAEKKTGQILKNHRGQILTKLEHSFLESLWLKYKPLVTVSLNEATFLYEATKRYLNQEAQEGHPVPSLVVETCAMCDGFCSMSLEEYRKVSDSDYQRMEIVKMARAEILGITTAPMISQMREHAEQSAQNNQPHPAMLLPTGHPNRPIGR